MTSCDWCEVTSTLENLTWKFVFGTTVPNQIFKYFLLYTVWSYPQLAHLLYCTVQKQQFWKNMQIEETIWRWIPHCRSYWINDWFKGIAWNLESVTYQWLIVDTWYYSVGSLIDSVIDSPIEYLTDSPVYSLITVW